MRSASVDAIGCLNVIVTASLETGPVYVLIVPRPCSGCGSENAPLTRWPGCWCWVSDRQRGVAGRGDDVGRRRRRVASRDARGEGPERPRRAERQRQRRRHGAAGGAGRLRVRIDAERAEALADQRRPRRAVGDVLQAEAPQLRAAGRDADRVRRAAHEERRLGVGEGGKAAGDSDDEVGVKRGRNAWSVSLNVLVNGAGRRSSARPRRPRSSPGWPARTRPSSTAGSRWRPARSSRAGRSPPAPVLDVHCGFSGTRPSGL